MLKNNSKAPCQSKEELINLLENWVNNTSEITIADTSEYNRRPWIFLEINNKIYHLNADTKRIGVIRLIENHKIGNKWYVVPNRNGVFNKVTNDLNKKSITNLFFYSEIASEELISI